MKKLTKKEQDLANNLINNKIAYNCNMCYEENNNIHLDIEEIDSSYIIDKTYFGLHITADNKDIFIHINAKELLTCLSTKRILELKENLKIEIDNL